MSEHVNRTKEAGEEVRTSEYEIVPELTEDELVVAKRLAAPSDSLQDARTLIAAALWELDAAGDDAAKARLHRSLGLVLEHRLGDTRRAIQHFMEAWRLAPRDRAAMRCLRRLFASRQNWSMVLRMLDAELEQAEAPARQAELLLEKGRIYEGQLANSGKAQELYLRALRLDPSHRRVLYRLRRLYWRRQDSDGLIDICRRAAAVTNDRKYRGLLLAEMARLMEDAQKDLEAAAATYAAAFLEDPSLSTVSEALKRLYRAQGRWGDLVEVLITEGELGQGEREPAHAFLSAARICREQLSQPERALELYRRAQRLIPDDSGILQDLVQLYQEVGRYEELADAYLGLLQAAEVSEQVVLHYRLGRVLEERLDRADEALVHYRRAVALDTSYMPALQALGKLCQRRGLWEELIAISAAEVELISDPEDRAGRYCSLGELCQEQLGDRDNAIGYHRRALSCAPRFPAAERALRRLYTATARWAELVELIEAQESDPPPRTADARLTQLGRLCEERLGDAERAKGYYRRALAQDPENVEVLQALEGLCTAGEQYEELLALLDQEISHTSSGRLQLALRHQAAELCSHKLQREAEAIERYRAILSDAPAHGPSMSSLGRIYYRQGKWQEVLELYQLEVSQESVAAERLGPLLFKMGEISLERLDDAPAAQAAFRRALEICPSYLPALQALGELYQRQGDWQELLAVRLQQAEAPTNPNVRAVALYQAGELCELKLAQPTAAVQHYREALALSPGKQLYLDALLRICSAAGRWREMAEIYERMLVAVSGDPSTVAITKRMGEIWDRRLANPRRAAEYYERALGAVPEDLEALEALVKLYQRLADEERLAAVLERQAQRSKDGQEAVALLYEAADVLELHLPERDPAPLYERVLRQSPGELPASAALESLYCSRGDLQGLLRVYRVQLAQEQDPEAKSALLLEVAQELEALGQPEEALGALEQAAELAPDWIAAREIRRLREKSEDWAALAEALQREAQLSGNRPAAVESLMKAAILYQDRLEAPERAADVLKQICEQDPFNDEAAVRLEQLLVPSESWGELVEVYGRRLAAAAEQQGQNLQGQIELLTRIAWIQREHLQRPEEAVATLRRCARIDPNHLPTLITLGELLLAQEQWVEAAEVFAKVVMVSDDPQVLRSAHFQLGELFSERLGNVRQAISSYQNVLAITPDDRAALGQLYELFQRDKDWENSADVVSRLLAAEKDPSRLVTHFSELADIQEKGFGDPQKAAEQLQRALEIDPTQSAVMASYSRLCSHLGDWEALCTALRSFLAALPVNQEGRGIQYRTQLGEILTHRLGRPAEALEQYQAVVEIDPTSVDARLAIASILAEQGDLEGAIAEHREVQGLDDLNLESLRQMRSSWSRMGQHDLAYRATAVLVSLGEALEDEVAAYRERRSQGVRLPQVPLADELFAAVLVHPGEPKLGRALLAALGEVAHRLRPPRLAEWQVGKADRLASRSGDPLKELVQEVATLLGLEREVDVFISPSRSRELDLLLTDPPALVVGAGVMGAFSSLEVRFRVAQLLSYVRNQTWIACGLSGGELRTLIQAARLVGEPKLGGPGEEDEAQIEVARQIQRNLSRRGRRALEDACRELALGGEPDTSSWALDLRHTSWQVGLWAVNDLETAFGWLTRLELAIAAVAETQSPLTPAVRRSALATELIHFWLSEEYHALRQGS